MRSSISQLSASYSQRSGRRRREHSSHTNTTAGENSIPGDEMLEILRRSQSERRMSASQLSSGFAMFEPMEDAADHVTPSPPMYSSLNKKNVPASVTASTQIQPPCSSTSSPQGKPSDKRPQVLNAPTLLMMGNHRKSNPLSPSLSTPNMEGTASYTPHMGTGSSTSSTAAPTPMQQGGGIRENLFSRALLQNSARVVGEAKGCQTMKPIMHNAGVQVDLIVEAATHRPRPPPVQPSQQQHYPALEQHNRNQLQNALVAAQVEERRERTLISDVFHTQWKKLTTACTVDAKHRQEMEREMALLLQPRRCAFNTSANTSAHSGGGTSVLHSQSVNTSYNTHHNHSAPAPHQPKAAATSKLDSSFKKSLNWIRERKQQQQVSSSGLHFPQAASANTSARMGAGRWGPHSTPPSFLQSGALV